MNTDHTKTAAIVYDSFPYPPVSGDNSRIAELIDALRVHGWKVHLVSTALATRKQRRIAESYVDKIHFYKGYGIRTRIRRILRIIVRTIDRFSQSFGLPPAETILTRIVGKPIAKHLRDYWRRYPGGLDSYLASLVDEFFIKIVIVEYVWLHPAINKLPSNVIRILDTHDVQYKRIEEFASRGLQFPLEITKERESEIFRKFNALVAIQEKEANLIKEMAPDIPVVVAGTTGSPPGRSSAEVEHGNILYVGGSNSANYDGLSRFLAHSWPIVQRKAPASILHICGYISRAFKARQYNNVHFHGYVENMEPFYAKADIVVNPIWIGTGLKIKTVEALARGKVLVTTQKGIEGMPEEVSDCCRIVNDEIDFATSIVELINDNRYKSELAFRANSYASRFLTLESNYYELFSFLDTALAMR